MSILDEIFAQKKLEVAAARRAVPLAELRAAAQDTPERRDFAAALAQRNNSNIPALIAEIKRSSPSKGLLLANFDPLRLAQIYAANGASAISVLTDRRYFKGSLDILRQVRQSGIELPLLRKDFLFDPYQVYEARLAGADAILLIAAYLEPALLADLQGLAQELGMAALVEVHTLQEIQAVLPLHPAIIGINNRDLHTFQVSLETTRTLRPQIPAEISVVAESGIHTVQDVQHLAQAGVQAVLVGEALVTAPDIAAKVSELAGVPLAPVEQSPTFPSLLDEDGRRKRVYCEG